MTIRKKILMMLFGIILTSLSAGLLYFFTLTGEVEKLFASTHKSVNVNGSQFGDKGIEATKPITILLMGVDTGSATRTDEWAGNSDTMILLTVNPKTKTTTMMSLERDILTDLYNGKDNSPASQAKLNAAYQEGEVAGSIATIQKLMNVQIDHYAMINMQGMVQLVDEINGITVNNTLGFPISIEAQEPEYTATIEPGKQKLNGEQALVYARMRYEDPQGDYGRQKRQREVIKKIIEKTLSMNNVSRYQDILGVVANNLQTSIKLNAGAIQQLLGYQKALKNIKNYQLTGVDAMFEGTSYQVVTKDHLLEMQNVLQTALGKEKHKHLETSAITYEDIYGASSETPDYSGDTPLDGGASTADGATGYGTETYGSNTYSTDSYGTESYGAETYSTDSYQYGY